MLKSPTLALFGQPDNNILAGKNSAAREAALRAGGNRDFSVRILPGADHMQRFVPVYFTTVESWLSQRVGRGWVR